MSSFYFGILHLHRNDCEYQKLTKIPVNQVFHKYLQIFYVEFRLGTIKWVLIMSMRMFCYYYCSDCNFTSQIRVFVGNRNKSLKNQFWFPRNQKSTFDNSAFPFSSIFSDTVQLIFFFFKINTYTKIRSVKHLFLLFLLLLFFPFKYISFKVTRIQKRT